MRLIIDAHLDLGWVPPCRSNATSRSAWTRSAARIGMTDERCRGKGVVSLPEMRRAGVGVCRRDAAGPRRARQSASRRATSARDLDFATQHIAYCAAQAQLAYYRLMEARATCASSAPGRARGALGAYRRAPVRRRSASSSAWKAPTRWSSADQVQEWWDNGLRAVGPAHYGRSHYAYGTGVDGPLAEAGVELLRKMERSASCSTSRTCPTKAWPGARSLHGPVLASHHNCLRSVPGDRQLTDEQIKVLLSATP